jgi:radical SAM superfamily enzyme YgiQ (UPF0313 family)
MADIVLCTLNARYSHASLGLRCLYANLGSLQPRARIVEFTVATPIEAMVRRILALSPRVLGLGVYIWNVSQTAALLQALRTAAPRLHVVLGGPEVSHELDAQAIVALADHVITGPGDLAFARLCRQLLDGPRPLMKVIAGDVPEPDALASPYRWYDEADIAHRNLYVEASRGCPFRCEFCLSALEPTARPFDLQRFLAEMGALHARGARRFKFVDRTFNLKVASSAAILEFFLQRIAAQPDDPVFVHFELVPDHLPAPLRAAIARFPPGCLQFEIGIQTWNPAVQATISRRQDNERAAANLRWLRAHSHAHLHVDLIAGLPGEDLASFGAGFDRLVALAPHEIQVGLLKRLRGAPIARHSAAFGLRFDTEPPYQVRATDALPAAHVQRVARFARYWDLYANSGRFPGTLPVLLADAPFARFMRFADWLVAHGDHAHRSSLETRAERLHRFLIEQDGHPEAFATERLAADYGASGARGRPGFLARGLAGGVRARGAIGPTPARQARHLPAPSR